MRLLACLLAFGLAGCTWPDRPAATAPLPGPPAATVVANPTNAEQAIINAQVARSQRRMDGYLQNVQLALQLDPNYEPAVAEMGVVQAAAGDYRAASLTLTRALQLNPNDGQARLNLAEATWRLGDTQSALREILLIEKQQPANARAFYLEACVYATTGQDALAVHRFTHAYNLSMDPSILLRRGLIHQRLGNAGLARYDFEQVLVHSEDPNTLQQARQGLMALGRGN